MGIHYYDAEGGGGPGRRTGTSGWGSGHPRFWFPRCHLTANLLVCEAPPLGSTAKRCRDISQGDRPRISVAPSIAPAPDKIQISLSFFTFSHGKRSLGNVSNCPSEEICGTAGWMVSAYYSFTCLPPRFTFCQWATYVGRWQLPAHLDGIN